MPLVTDEALGALKDRNSPPKLFQIGGVLTRVRNDLGEVKPQELDEHSLRGHLARSANWARSKGAEKDSTPLLTATSPPKNIANDILTLECWPDEVFPRLRGIVHSPYFTADGTLVNSPGYHPGSQLWLAMPRGLHIAPIPSPIRDEDLVRARSWLLDELLVNFPFKTPSDLATALGYLLTPLAREFITGPIPFCMIQAPVMGTGKSKLAECLLVPAIGNSSTTAQPGQEEEWRKNITSKLIEGAQAILYDNLKGALRSQALEEVLTSTSWTDRVLGESRVVSLPVRCLWMGTANNLQIQGDLIRRLVYIWLDAKMERPDDRKESEFKHPLPSWAYEHRGDLLWAALVMIKAWVERGRPPGPRTMASFESWAKTIGGILEVAGVEGFLHEQTTRRIDADDDSAQMEAFLHSIRKKLGSEAFGVKDLDWVVDPQHPEYDQEMLLGLIHKETKDERAKALGHLLKRKRGCVYGRFQLVDAGEESRGRRRLYKVERLKVSKQPVITWDPKWDEATARKNPLVEGPVGLERSRVYWEHVVSRGVSRDLMEDYGGQLWDACHALWLSCRGMRLVTDRAIVRLTESAGILPRFFPNEYEYGRTIDFFDRLDDVNFVLEGLMEINLYDLFQHDGRRIARYGILEGPDLAGDTEPPVQGSSAATNPPGPEPWLGLDLINPDCYPIVVDLFRRWWRFENHKQSSGPLLSLVHEFNLLPGFESFYPWQPQKKELARLLVEIRGMEFDGFFLQFEPWPEETWTEQGVPDYFFTLYRLRGFVPPPIPLDPWDPRERQKWVKESETTLKQLMWLLDGPLS